ncbi:uncharacterized protein K02A2.6-like [Phymastichus coffea]|uniref:uncharacterized protein K02A2.6-like n=1 Tax=Phymastichus coffea TaxID=108790 RepID=UPI00273BCC62|nr:uncharacterized protein K02A2.6-like [Phymastichus coffea]
MAIVFGCKKFYQFIFGKFFILRTDNKALEYILGPRKGIPQTADNRLQRWVYFLSGFRYITEHVSSKANANCDALSRLPIDDNIKLTNSKFSHVYFFDEGLISYDYKILANESKTDKEISQAIKYVMQEWPSNDTNLSGELKSIFEKRLELCVEKGCLFWGLRAIVPKNMRRVIINELHATHLGIVKIKMFSRSYVWWPGIDNDIERMVRECNICIIERKKPPHTPLTTWPYPSKAWGRIHCDFAELIQKLFARHGLPLHCVTDGGPQFRSDEFCKFLANNGVKHSFSPPYHPATNGAAENKVQIFKDKVKKIVKGGETVDNAINMFLFDYRSIDHCTTGKSPAYLLYKRELRTRFDKLRPCVVDHVDDKQRAQIVAKSGNRNVDFQIGDKVYVDDHGVRAEVRKEATIVRQDSPSTFVVVDKNDKRQKRDVDQMVSNKPTKLRRSPRLNQANN